MCDMSFSSLHWNFPVIIVILLEIMLNLPFKLNDLSESVCGVFSVVMLWSYQIVNARFFDARVLAFLLYDKILNRGEKFLPFFPIYNLSQVIRSSLCIWRKEIGKSNRYTFRVAKREGEIDFHAEFLFKK